MENYDWIYQSFWIGVGATLIMDLWAYGQKKFLDIPSLDYAWVGRWIGHMRNGQFSHDKIMASPAVPFEGLIGWGAHYLIGVVFAVGLLLVTGPEWINAPTLLPPLLVGVATVLFPFLIMQPALGFGVAASKTPAPNTARLRSLVAHFSFGVGLYLASLVLAAAGPI